MAVVLVVLFHLRIAWPEFPVATGGFVGVDLFLTLSGFLITALLLSERERTGAIAFGGFLVRRLRRLVPALVAILTVAFAIAVTDRWYADNIYSVKDVATVTVWSLTFTANWAAVRNVPLVPLGHVWTVALEAQFYVLWGFALVLASRARRTRTVALVVAAPAIVAIVSGRWLSFDNNPTEVVTPYVSTLTRLDAPLLGAVAAVFVVSGRAERLGGAAWEIAGALGIVALLTTAQFADPYQPEMFRGGYTVVAAVATTAVLGAVMTRDRLMGRVLRARALVQAGRISYSLYLWHLPVFYLVARQARQWPQLLRAVVGIAISVPLAWLSYRYVEQPFLRRKVVPATARTAEPAVAAA